MAHYFYEITANASKNLYNKFYANSKSFIYTQFFFMFLVLSVEKDLQFAFALFLLK